MWKVLSSIAGVIIITLLGIIGTLLGGLLDEFRTIKTIQTGHLIQHGSSDTQLEILIKSMDKFSHNQLILCRYGEMQWQDHDRCLR